MGCAISCRLFERFSRALSWIMTHRFQVRAISHILDDFIFVGPPNSNECANDLQMFLKMCEDLNVPIKISKTQPPSEIITVHGVEIDTKLMEARLPLDKLHTLCRLLNVFSSKKKCILKELQSLVGHLNFACKVIVPGRVFKRRIARLMVGCSKPHHHIRLTRDFRKDIKVWQSFLDCFNGRSIFLAEVWSSSQKLNFWSDACGQGGASVLGNHWFYIEWPPQWSDKSIAILEFAPIVVGLEIWAESLRNTKVLFNVDNIAVVDIINNHTSKDDIILMLLRHLVL